MKREWLMYLCAVVLALCPAADAMAARRAKQMTVEGRLGRTVEAGGWVIKTDGQKYLLLNARRFEGESWFREGAEVEAVGETKPDVVSIYMEGVPFEARTVRPQGGAGAGAVTGGGAERDGGARTRVTVLGEATVQSQPDTAVVSIAVVTQNRSASEAQAENASKSDAVVRAVKAAAGRDAEVKTGGYSLQPQYAYKQNEAPTITSYVARNSVTVTMGELDKVGAVIDAASRAGANSVDSLNFTLRRDRPARGQALSEATRDALSKAQTVAQALGGRLVRIVEVQEGGGVRPPVPIPYARAELRVAQADAPQTPIEAGTLDIRAQVQLTAEIETKP